MLEFTGFNSPQENLSQIISPQPSIRLLRSGKDNRKYEKRSSLPVKKKHMKHESQDVGRTSNKLVTKVSEYLSIGKKLISQDSDCSSEVNGIQATQDDKIFTSKEVADDICSLTSLMGSKDFDTVSTHQTFRTLTFIFH